MAEGKLKLNAKQKQFAEEYLIDLNATQACIRAGYSENSAKEMGYENLTKPHIAEYVAELQAKRSERVEISADYVLSGLKAVAERCMQAEQVIAADGSTSGKYKFEHSGANTALIALGKHLKMFTEKSEVSGPDGGPIKTETSFKVEFL